VMRDRGVRNDLVQFGADRTKLIDEPDGEGLPLPSRSHAPMMAFNHRDRVAVAATTSFG
jgi:hypothetical protein